MEEKALYYMVTAKAALMVSWIGKEEKVIERNLYNPNASPFTNSRPRDRKATVKRTAQKMKDFD